jgi:ABC-2 type transport system permease protein
MLKLFLIGFKDVTLAFRDRAALILMLAAPFVLTLAMGVVTGRFSGAGSTGIGDIPVVIVNQDDGQLGQTFVEVMTSADLDGLLDPVLTVIIGHQQVDDDEVAAAVVCRPTFHTIIRRPGRYPADPAKIQIYVNPNRSVSAGVVRAIVDEFINRLEVARATGQVAVTQLILNGIIAPSEALTIGEQMGERLQAQATDANAPADALTLRLTGQNDQPVPEFDILAYLAPGMAMLFLMYTVSNGGRSILQERAQGTLPRLLVSPTTNAQVLGGKLLGIYLTGLAQMGILIGASSLLFGLKWGDPLGVVALIVAVVAAATGWGSLLAAIAKTPAQVATMGSAIMLTFGILGGSFISIPLPSPINLLARLTPNSWGQEGFATLGLGGTLAELATPLLALLIMAAVLFAIATVLFRRQAWGK